MFRRRAEGGDHLDNLQRDSWQLELIVTGFALAGMIGGEPVMREWADTSLVSDNDGGWVNGVLAASTSVLMSAYYITLFNFFINVVSRCLWIAAIGVRSVNPRIRYQRIRLAPRFERYLQRRNGSFDRYIHRLDDFSSLIFAITFLMIALVISLFAYGFFVGVTVSGLKELVPSGSGAGPLVGLAVAALLLMGVLYFIDFLTLGYLKRFRWLSYVYYPFYRLYGWVTLARLYRPFYYNLVTNSRTRFVPLIVVVYLVVFAVLSTLTFTPINYLSRDRYDYNDQEALLYRPHDYADQESRDPDRAVLILPSEVIEDRILKVRVAVRPVFDKYIAGNCPDLALVHETNLGSSFLEDFYAGATGEHGRELDSNYLECLLSPVRLRLDDRSVPLDEDVLFNYLGSERGTYAEFIVFVPLDSLERGVHRVTLHRQSQVRSDTVPDPAYDARYTVPFYYAPAG